MQTERFSESTFFFFFLEKELKLSTTESNGATAAKEQAYNNAEHDGSGMFVK